MTYTIKKLAALAGVSIRTLRYYDEIQLLIPKRMKNSEYRIYEEAEVDRLQQILFYREMGLELSAIKEILDAESFEQMAALKSHLVELQKKRKRLDLYQRMEKLGTEINHRLASAVREGIDPMGAEGKEIAMLHKEWLNISTPKYTAKMHRGIAEMYVCDERFTAYYYGKPRFSVIMYHYNPRGKSMLNYRELTAEEAELIKQIDATHFIKNVWRMNDDSKKYELTEINWTDYELPNGLDWHLNRFQEIFLSGGKAFGCFEENKLVGYVTLNAEIFGMHEKYVLLDQLFVSKDYRSRGIGKELITLCKKQAAAFGAEKIFLCAGSAENTIAFYKKIGCQHATEINQELYEEDPRDIQLELEV